MESFYPNSSRQHQQQQLQQHQRLQQQQLQQQQQQQQQLLQSQHNNPYAQQQQQQGVIPAGPSPLSTSSPHSITYHQQSPMIQTGTGSASYSSTPNNYPVSGGLFGGPSSEQKTRSVGNNSGNMSYGRDSYHSGGGLGYGGIGGMSSYGGNQNNDHPRASSSSAKGGNGAAGQSGNGSQGAAAKRGSKACVACRKGKNRCEMDPNSNSAACKRCLASNTACVFEKITDKARGRNSSIAAPEGLSGDAEGRVSHLERSVNDLARGQNQIQSALQQILNMLPQNSSFPAQNTIPYLQQQDAGVPTANIFNNSVSPPSLFNQSPSSLQAQNQGLNQQNHFIPHQPQLPQSPQNIATGRSNESGGDDRGRNREKKRVGDFPKLPGFAPPNHRFGTYGIIPLSSAPASPAHSRHSSRSSSSHSVASSSALPQDSLTAPIQALQALANAADQAAATRRNNGHDTEDEKTKALDTGMNSAEEGNEDEAAHDKGDGSARKRKRVTIDPKGIHLRVKKKTKPDPTPRNPFPDVVTKGLVDEQEARELWDVFFSGCHYFVPLWDKTYDTYESYIERTPFSTNGLLAVAAKIRAGNGPLGETFHRCLEEAQGIARSTLFGPIVRKEAVMAMLILSVWSQNGWLPCGHALRGGLDMNLHKALDKLNAETPQPRSETEERDLVVSARIWLNCYMHEHLVSLGTAKPLLLRDDASVRHARLLLTHPMASETDMRLVAGVELVNLRVRVVDHLSPLHGKVDAQTISFVRRMFTDLQSWYREWYSIHRTKYDEESVLVKLLEAELVYAQLWTVCVALRGCAWDKLPAEQRELAFQAKDAALRCLEIFLRSPNFRAHLKYATHDQLVSVAFAAVFLLKIAILYPSSIALPSLISQVAELAHLLSSECFAERYALTLRLMLSNFRRKTGALSTMPGTPRLGAVGDDITHGDVGGLGNGDAFNGDLEGGLQSLLSLPQMDFGENNVAGDWGMEGMEGFSWPTEFSPSNLPVWLQDGNFTDLGLPQDGSDSLFLPPELANMFLPSGTAANGSFNFTLPDSGDVGAEAW